MRGSESSAAFDSRPVGRAEGWGGHDRPCDGRMESLERLKHRIHNFRIPIRDKRALFLVKVCYFLTPIILGCALMNWVTPDPEELRQRMRPSDQAIAVTEEQKARLRGELRRYNSRSAN